MNLGSNSNVQLGDRLYHVQTEDRGSGHPFIDTIVLSEGQVLHRRRTSYEDLLTSGPADETVLRARVERQHRDILEALREGSLPLERVARGGAPAIEVKLRNLASWLEAGQASLEIDVCSRGDGHPIAGVDVEVSIEGAAGGPVPFVAQTNSEGRASLRFPLPQIAEPGAAAMVIRARTANTQDQLRYNLKAKPSGSTPSAQ